MLYGQMAERNSPDLTCIQMIGTSVCYVSVLVLLQQFIRSRRLVFFRLMMTFSSCLHGFLRDQNYNFQTHRIPLTDTTVFLNDKWELCLGMNDVYLRNDESGSADLLTSATDGSQLRIYDSIPQTTHQAVKLQTVLLPLFPDIEQQCKQLQDIRTCRTSESRQPLLCNNLSATSFTLTPPTPESSSSSSPVDHSQPLHRESLRPSGEAGILPPPDVAVSLTMRYINGVSRCVVFTGSEDPCCSYSWSTRGSTSLALFPPTPECTSSSSPVESSQPVRRELLRPSSDAWLVQPPDVILFLTTRNVNAVGRGVVFRGRRRTQVVLVLSQTQCVYKSAEGFVLSYVDPTVMPTKPDHLRLQKKRRRRSCCPVLLCFFWMKNPMMPLKHFG